jgi:predicted transcriptional regulator
MLNGIVADFCCPPSELLIPQVGGGVLCCKAARKLVRQELADKPKVKIKVKEFVNDVRQGMDDQSLIRKYSLNVTMLPKVLDQLVAAGHLNEQDLAARNIFDSTQKVAQLFSFPGDELE